MSFKLTINDVFIQAAIGQCSQAEREELERMCASPDCVVSWDNLQDLKIRFKGKEKVNIAGSSKKSNKQLEEQIKNKNKNLFLT